MRFTDKAVVWVATGFGLGFIPLIPGTFGTLPGLVICYFLAQVPVAFAAPVVIGFIALSMGLAGAAERLLGKKDPGHIVIDEIAGLAVALFGLPFDAFHVVAGFITFRIFDAWKPYPLKKMEKRFAGGVGVVIDDVGAGIYANILVRLLALLVATIR